MSRSGPPIQISESSGKAMEGPEQNEEGNEEKKHKLFINMSSKNIWED